MGVINFIMLQFAILPKNFHNSKFITSNLGLILIFGLLFHHQMLY